MRRAIQTLVESRDSRDSLKPLGLWLLLEPCADVLSNDRSQPINQEERNPHNYRPTVTEENNKHTHTALRSVE